MNRYLTYQIVRVVPDLMRGEMLNVALVGVFDGHLFSRSLGATRCLESMLNANQLRNAQNLPMLLDTFKGSYPYFSSSGIIGVKEEPDPGFLEFLYREGFGGCYFDEPREQLLQEPCLAAAENAFTALYSRLIIPRLAPTERPAATRSRAKTIVRRMISEVDMTGDRIATNVVFRNAKSQAEYIFDFAFANGKPTFAQSLDLETSSPTQMRSTDHAIANIAELRRILGSQPTGWLNVVQVGRNLEAAQPFIERLQNWGRVVQLPADREFLLQLLRYEAKSDVRKALGDHFALETKDKAIEVIIDPVQEQSL